jgi:hypothetical protein
VVEVDRSTIDLLARDADGAVSADIEANDPEFAVVLGHRILNDLTMVVGSAEILQEKQLSPDEQDNLVGIIGRHTARLEEASQFAGLGNAALGTLSTAISCAAELTLDAFRRHDRRSSGKTLPVLEVLLDHCVEVVRELV